jgi:MFS family permease
MPLLPSHLERRFDDLRRVFRVRAFALFSLGNFSSLMAIWIIRVCIAWIAWEQTRSKTWLGVMAFAELGPSVLVTVWSGPLADRLDKVRILRWGQSIQTLLALLLLVLAVTRSLNVWWMMAALLGFSFMAGLTLPARMAVAPSLVPRDQVATASAIGSISLNMTRLAGPILAAVFLASNQEAAAFGIAALGFALNAYCLSRIPRAGTADAAPARPSPGETRSYGEVILGVARDLRLSLVLVLQFLGSLFLRPVTDMFPAFADQVFNRGEHGFAALTAAVGVGAILGAGLMIGGSDARLMLRQVYYGTVAFAIAGLAFAWTPGFVTALFVLAVFGALLTTSGIAGTSYVQINTPTAQLGRVMAIYSIIFRLGPAIGALCLGAVADRAGVSAATAGFAMLALAILVALWPIHRRAVKV